MCKVEVSNVLLQIVSMDFKEVLNEFDRLEKKKFSLLEVASALKSVLPSDRSLISFELNAEIVAFNLAENYQDNITSWGTYYGPKFVSTDLEGNKYEIPSYESLNSDVLDYWENRAKQTVNPILISIYSGLVCDLRKQVTTINPNYQIIRIYISSIIKYADGDYHKYTFESFQKLKRALDYAISYNQKDSIKSLINSFLNFEKRLSSEDRFNCLHYSFDYLIENKYIELSKQDQQHIIQNLESDFYKLTEIDVENHTQNNNDIEFVGKRLIKYYNSKNEKDKVKILLLRMRDAFYKDINPEQTFLSLHWLEKLNSLFIEFNLIEESDNLLVKIKEISPTITKNFVSSSLSHEISKEQFQIFLNDILNGTFDEIVFKIYSSFIPNYENVKKKVLANSREFVFGNHIPIQLIDEKGRKIAQINPFNEDQYGHYIRYGVLQITVYSFFLKEVFDRILNSEVVSKESLFNFLSKSPIILPERYEIILKGLECYYNFDYVVFLHLIIPQIEEAVRNVLEFSSGNVLKTSKNGGLHLKNFNDILSEIKVIESLGEDIVFFFKILFTDSRGINLRNNLSHGLLNPKNFNRQNADLVILALLCLGLVEEKKS